MTKAFPMTRRFSPYRLAIITALVTGAVLSFSVEAAEACHIPFNDPFESRPSDNDSAPPVLREVTSVATLGRDGCGECAGEHWVVTVDGQDTPATEAREPAVGYRIEVLDGEVYLEPEFNSLTPEIYTDNQQILYVYGDVDEFAIIRITPSDRSGNEGEPVVHILEPISRDSGACSALGRTPGVGMLPLLVVLLFVGRRRSSGTFLRDELLP